MSLHSDDNQIYLDKQEGTIIDSESGRPNSWEVVGDSGSSGTSGKSTFPVQSECQERYYTPFLTHMKIPFVA